MTTIPVFDREALLQEVSFKYARSGGAGGQHVNKVSSKVILSWSLTESTVFSEEQRTRLQEKLGHRMSKLGVLQLESQDDRSQHRNKELAVQRFLHLISEALRYEKPRKPTKIPKSKILARLDNKKRNAVKKKLRGNSGWE